MPAGVKTVHVKLIAAGCGLLLLAGGAAAAGEPPSAESVKRGVERELVVDGIVLARDGHRLEIELANGVLTASIVDVATGEVIAVERVISLPDELDATVAHMAIIVAAMVSRLDAEPSPPMVRSPAVAPPRRLDPAPPPVVTVAPSPRTWFVGASVGRGASLINSGQTEATRTEVSCCVALEGVAFRAEAGGWISDRWALSGVARLGLPGANVDGAATHSIAALARASVGDRGWRGFSAHLEAGVGLIRSAVAIDGEAAGMDLDTVSSGPLLAGAGLRWGAMLGRHARLFVDAGGLVGLPVVDEIGGSRPGTALNLELAAGVAWHD